MSVGRAGALILGEHPTVPFKSGERKKAWGRAQRMLPKARSKRALSSQVLSLWERPRHVRLIS